MRLFILRLIDHLFFKTPEGVEVNLFLKTLYKILFPIKSTYESQSGCHFNPLTNVYTIMGIKYHSGIFEAFSEGMLNRPFIISTREDGVVTITDYEQEAKECEEWCGMNYCDENGCADRKRNMVADSLINLQEN